MPWDAVDVSPIARGHKYVKISNQDAQGVFSRGRESVYEHRLSLVQYLQICEAVECDRVGGTRIVSCDKSLHAYISLE